ncbi:MAG: aminotransferase class V-fold PLP-dependent enzyme [Myxococcota bacterium]
MSLERFRASFEPIAPLLALNAAGISRCCRPAIEAISTTAAGMARGVAAIPEILDVHEAARASVGRLVGAPAERVSMFHTCAAALSQVALGFPLGTGDEIVTWDQEYPSNAYPWYVAARRAGGRVVAVPSAPNLEVETPRLVEAIGPRTRIVAISWVQYQTGALTDLHHVAEACRRVGAWLVVDAAQALGVLPFDLEQFGVDVVCGASHKWLTGPIGHGFAAFAEGRLEELEPLAHGAITYGTPDERTDPMRSPRQDPRRFEPGTPLALGAAGMGAAIELLLRCGVDVIGAEALRLADRLSAGLRELGHEVLGHREGSSRSPIVTFLPGAELPVVRAALDAAQISYSLRAGGVRLSPHAYNTDEDIDVVLQVLSSTASTDRSRT